MAEMKKLLLADDDKMVHVMFAEHITELGFELLHAYDGSEALELAREQCPDIIILDITMPELDGRDVCRELKNDAVTRDIPVIMLTAKDAQHDKMVGHQVGADNYLTKPCMPFELKRAIIRLTDK